MSDDKKFSSTLGSAGWEAAGEWASARRSSTAPVITPIPLGGLSSFTRADADGKPADWSKWAHMLTAELWKAVALSMDIEPKSSPVDFHSISGGPFDDCSPEFRRRIDIAANRSGRDLKCVAYTSSEFHHEVNLEVFALWATKLDWGLPPSFPGARKAALEPWKFKDLWSERELQDLCCGFIPDAGRPSTEELNEAAEAIRRAAMLGDPLRAIKPTDATEGDRLYDHGRLFRPSVATAWASGRFPKFPFNVTDFPFVVREVKPEGKEAETLSTREKRTLLKLVIGMAIGGYTYNPEAARSSASTEIASDLAEHGISLDDDTVRKWLKEAAETVLEGKASKP